jgi:hypothetical protein
MQKRNQTQNEATVGKWGIIIVKQRSRSEWVGCTGEKEEKKERLAKGLGAYSLLT